MSNLLRSFATRTCRASSRISPSPYRLQGLRRAITTKHTLPGLPYDPTDGVGNFLPPPALATVLEFQEGLLDRLNDEVRGTEFENQTVVDTVINTAPFRNHTLAFNYASLALNNSFFLKGIRPLEPHRENHEHAMKSSLKAAIRTHYTDLDELKSEFSAAAMGLSASGWVWLVTDKYGQLGIVPTHGAGTLLIRSRAHLGRNSKVLLDHVASKPVLDEEDDEEEEEEEEYEEDEFGYDDDLESSEDNQNEGKQTQAFGAGALYEVLDPEVPGNPSLNEQWAELTVRQKLNALSDFEEFQDDHPFAEQIQREMENFPDEEELAAELESADDAEEDFDEEEYEDDDDDNDGTAPPSSRGAPPSRPTPGVVPPGVAPSSPLSGVSSSVNPSSPKHLMPKFMHTSSVSHSSLNHNYGKPSSVLGPASSYEHLGDRRANSRSKVDMLNTGKVVYPILCLSVHEHAWITAGYGVWGKEAWLREFWSVVDWEKVGENYEEFATSTGASFDTE